jgi:hypothetical protein
MAAVLLASGCGGGGSSSGSDGAIASMSPDGRVPITRVRSFEGQYCSSTPDDEPYQECASDLRLICISTNSRPVPDAGARPVFLCHAACDPKGPACPVAGDLCCAGTVYGQKETKGFGCVPPTLCAPSP